jgi:methyltransferase (TIGR00027 family)
MKAGEASETAQRVAAHRLAFERVPAPYGDPDADERLARDVAGPSPVATSSGGMVKYLAARTAFFDRVVVGALDRGITQVVIAAAGYDGRALRYAKSGVRWFEVDHPDTQRDKRERVGRLGLVVDHIAFVPADFTVNHVAAALAAAGHDASTPSVFTCEGVAVYLERDVLTSLFAQLRRVAASGSRFAVSLSVQPQSATDAARRAAVHAAVGAMGEPARTVLTEDEAAALIAATGWRTVDSPTLSDRAKAAGFVILEPT